MRIEIELRPCIVSKKRETRVALFHQWGNTSVLNGFREFAGTITVGYVEYKDGTVEAVNPGEIKFTDNKFKKFYFG